MRQVKDLKDFQKKEAFSQFLKKPQALIRFAIVPSNYDFNKQYCFLIYSAFLEFGSKYLTISNFKTIFLIETVPQRQMGALCEKGLLAV